MVDLLQRGIDWRPILHGIAGCIAFVMMVLAFLGVGCAAAGTLGAAALILGFEVALAAAFSAILAGLRVRELNAAAGRRVEERERVIAALIPPQWESAATLADRFCVLAEAEAALQRLEEAGYTVVVRDGAAVNH